MRTSLLLGFGVVFMTETLCASAGFFFQFGKRVPFSKTPEEAVQHCINPNTYLCLESFKELMSKSPSSPSFQRGVKDERVARLTSDIQKYRKSASEENLSAFPVPFLGSLHIVKLTASNRLYIVDGQHRFAAFREFYQQEKIDFKVCYIVKECKTKEEMKTYFVDINTQLAQHNVMLALSTLGLYESVKTHIEGKYDKHIKTSQNPRWPNVNVDTLANFMANLLRDEQTVDGVPPVNIDFDNLIERIEEENDKAAEMVRHIEPDKHKIASEKQGLFISFLMKRSKT